MTKYECLSIFSLQVEAIVFLCLSKHFFKRSGKMVYKQLIFKIFSFVGW